MIFQVTSNSINEIGQRGNQEDSLYPSIEAPLHNSLLYILCDGMGGHAAGEVASQTVCSALSDYILARPSNDGIFEERDFSKALEYAYAALDERDTDDDRKMGTTLAFALFHRGGCFIAHIGDSRVYHIRPSLKEVLFVTKDHSLVNELIELGELTLNEAKTSRQKNIITRAMQPHQDEIVKADCTNLRNFKEGDYLYMCSDGMLENMEDREIVNILSLPKPDSEKIRILTGATKDNRDNHSAHLIRILSVQNNKDVKTAERDCTRKHENPLLWSALVVLLIIIVCIVLFIYMRM